jgi:hypothetical protein
MDTTFLTAGEGKSRSLPYFSRCYFFSRHSAMRRFTSLSATIPNPFANVLRTRPGTTPRKSVPLRARPAMTCAYDCPANWPLWICGRARDLESSGSGWCHRQKQLMSISIRNAFAIRRSESKFTQYAALSLLNLASNHAKRVKPNEKILKKSTNQKVKCQSSHKILT